MESPDDPVALAAVRHRYDPLAWAHYAWDWGVGRLAGLSGPREWQADILTIIREHLADPGTRFEPLQLSVASGHGIGKAQPKELVVDTPTGKKRWGDIVVGDELFGADGKATRVIARHERGVRGVYRVTFDDGASTLVCGEHVWAVKGRNQRRCSQGFVEMTTEDIVRAGVRRSNGKCECRQWELPTSGPVEYAAQALPIDPYILGLWLGDGGRNTARITSMDSEVDFNIDLRGYTTHSGRKVGTEAKSITVHGIGKALRELGVFDKYSYEKRVPRMALENTAECRAEVLRGLLDTDGTANSAGSVIFSSTSRGLADDVVWLARSLGGKASVSPTVKMPWYTGKDGQHVPGRPCYNVVLNMPNGFRCFYVERKQSRLRPAQQRYMSRWISSIDLAGESECMCVTVEAQDGLYLTNDFIVTHNSALMGMISNWAMSCFVDAKIVCTANTEAQLRTKTVPEVSQWFRESITSEWFDPQATSVKAVDRGHADSWRMDFLPWSQNNTEAFAGLHNQGKIIVLLFDEASKIHDKVWEVAEGALTDEGTVIIWVAFGNPTQNSGRFRECFRRFRHRWVSRQIDSRTVPGTNKKKIQQWVEDHGEDSDFVKVRVRGQFPSQSALQFISEDDAQSARKCHLRKSQFDFAPVIISVDPAWSGDDELVIAYRQGLYFKVLRTMARNDNDIAVANIVARYEDELKAAAVNVDAGYGTGIVSAGRTMGRAWNLVWFSGHSPDPGCLNMRAYIWREMRDWLKQGGAIDPEDEVLYQDIIGPETVPRMDGKIQLESKEDMKDRGLPSPNRGDALALTFAHPVRPTLPPHEEPRKYDPLNYGIQGG